MKKASEYGAEAPKTSDRIESYRKHPTETHPTETLPTETHPTETYPVDTH